MAFGILSGALSTCALSPVTGIALAGGAAAMQVEAEGWSLAMRAPPEALDPIAAPVQVTVWRRGFDADAQAVEVAEAVTLMARVRRPWPDQAVLDGGRVALSDYIHAGDRLDRGRNGSTLDAPLPLAVWMTPDLAVARDPVFTARLAVAHAYARAGRAVAAVRFIASDGVSEVTQLVAQTTTASYASGLSAPCFEAAIPLDSLADGICTLDAEIYPWVGEMFRISLHASPYPSSNLSILKFVNDRSGTFGVAYATVDAAGGSDGTGSVAQSVAGADAAPFATIPAAAQAIRAFNAAQFGRDEAGGGVIRLQPGVHIHGAFGGIPVTSAPLVIEAADPAAKASTIYCDAGTSISAGCPAKLRLRNLTLRKTVDQAIFLDNGATLASLERMMVLENVTIDRNGTAAYGAWIYRTGRMFLHEVDGDAEGIFAFFNGNACKQITAVGCSGGWASDVIFNAVACRLGPVRRVVGFANIERGEGQLFSHCYLSTASDGKQVFLVAGAEVGARGVAMIGSVLEQSGGETGAALRMAADGDFWPVQNALFIGNTVAGARSNWLYQDSGTTRIAKRGVLRFCVNRQHNTKTDVFAQNGALTGNWAAAYNVGSRANVALEGDNMGTGPAMPGPGVWIGEVAALGDLYGSGAAPVSADFVADRSFTGTGTGGGDYSPGPESALARLPAGLAPFAVDMLGRALPDDGTALVGALQPG